jgi:energy-coupling factor transporter transmembrane protein EcfT
MLPSIVLISALICFILFSIWLSHYQKKSGLMILILLLLNAFIFIGILTYTSEYRQLKPYSTYKNRAYEVSVYKTSSFSNRFVKGYSKKVVEDATSFNYLGKDEHLYFFDKNDIIYSLDQNKELVIFDESTKQDVIVKEVYAELNDTSYSELGFKELVGPYIQEIMIPSKDKDKLYHPTSKTSKLADY